MSLFPNSRVIEVTRYPPGAPQAGQPMTVAFELDGMRVTALNAGPMFKFTEAVSMWVDCQDQAEVDRLWEALIADGGTPGRCGWLKDRWGLSWQIVPKRLVELMKDRDPGRAGRAAQAMMQMSKIDIAALEAAAVG